MKQIAFELKGELSNFILLLTSNLNNLNFYFEIVVPQSPLKALTASPG